MIKHLCLILALFLVVPAEASAISGNPFSLPVSLPANSRVQSVSVSVPDGEILEISAGDIERRLNMLPHTLTGITVTSLPDVSRGGLFLDGVEVEAYEYLTRAEVDKLCFVPAEAATTASITFVPNGDNANPTSLHINVISQPNRAPEMVSIAVDTTKNAAVSGYIPVIDPEEDEITLRLIQGPAKGRVQLNGQSFYYEPFRGLSGRDQFTVCALDSAGNFSADAVVAIAIEDTRSPFTYMDMAGNPSLYASVKLHESGVMTGRQLGGAWFFDPEHQVNRGDFIVMALAAMGRDTAPTVNTGLPNDSSIPFWLKPYVKAAMDEGMISSVQAFNWREIPMRCEAVAVIDRAANIRDVKDFALHMPDRANIPEWAEKSYKDLAAYKMLDLHDGNAYPTYALTNSCAADLIWQLYKHTHR